MGYQTKKQVDSNEEKEDEILLKENWQIKLPDLTKNKNEEKEKEEKHDKI